MVNIKSSSPGMRRHVRLLWTLKVHQLLIPILLFIVGLRLNWHSTRSHILRDGVTYGTSLKLVGVQIVALNSSAGVDTGDMATEDVAALFGKTEGFKQSEPNVTASDDDVSEEIDF